MKTIEKFTAAALTGGLMLATGNSAHANDLEQTQVMPPYAFDEGESGENENANPSTNEQPGIDETGHIWVDLPTGEHCYINMNHILEGSIVIDTVDGNTAGTPCDVGAAPFDWQIPEDYDRYLTELRVKWDALMQDAADTITDREDEAQTTYGELTGSDFDWLTDIGGLALLDEDPHSPLELNDANSAGYGPGGCHISGTDELRTMGEVTYADGTVYEVAIVLTPDNPATPCTTGDIVLIPQPQQTTADDSTQQKSKVDLSSLESVTQLGEI